MDTHPSSYENPGPLKLVVCGGGASAVLLLTALRSRFSGTIDVTILEPREQLGLGVAYSTQCPLHVLNTRARNMSATDDPDDFLNWLRDSHPRRPLNWTRNCFAPRKFYGEYLQARLWEAKSAANVRFRWLRSSADSISFRDGEWEVVPAKGDPVRADVVVLATGNEAPRALGRNAAPQTRPFIIDDPWDSGAKQEIGRNDAVLLVGTGLTAVDIAVELLNRGHAGPMYAVSRRGLLPRRHGPVHATLDGCGTTLPTSLRELVRHVREKVESDPRGSVWQGFINEMRSVAPTVWSSLGSGRASPLPAACAPILGHSPPPYCSAGAQSHRASHRTRSIEDPAGPSGRCRAPGFPGRRPGHRTCVMPASNTWTCRA